MQPAVRHVSESKFTALKVNYRVKTELENDTFFDSLAAKSNGQSDSVLGHATVNKFDTVISRLSRSGPISLVYTLWPLPTFHGQRWYFGNSW